MQDDMRAAKIETIESAKRYNYQLGDNVLEDETAAEFKAMSDEARAAKMESIESAKRYNYQLGDVDDE